MKKLFDLNNLVRLSLDETTINGTKHYKWGLSENREAGKNEWVINHERKINFVAKYNEATGLARDTTGEPFILDGCRPLIATINFALPNVPEIVLLDEVEQEKSDKHFIVSALNNYWFDATTNLERKDLGDLEKEIYLKQQSRAKEIMKKVEDSIYKPSEEVITTPLEISELWLEWEKTPESNFASSVLQEYRLKTSSDNKIKNAVVKFKEN